MGTPRTIVMSAAPAAIELKNVWKVFGPRAREAMDAINGERLGKAQVLERFGCVVGVADVSFAVAPGETFCVMGLSGSGKSTLVRLINRLIEPTAGQILVGRDDLGALDEAALRAIRGSRIAMVFQDKALMPHRTVRDNVALGLEIRNVPRLKRWEIAERMLELVNLSGWEDRYPAELSGGMQQRVGLARALAADPAILLMDEPFSALDPLIRRQLQEFFLDLAARLRKTTVFVTHDLDEAIRLGTRIAIMNDGRIVQIGTPERIVMHPADDYVADFVRGISKLRIMNHLNGRGAAAPRAGDPGPPRAGATSPR
jgi:glycine betaine/proline transport system ATP-binding protein